MPTASYLVLAGGVYEGYTSGSVVNFTRNLSLTAGSGLFKLAGGGFSCGGVNNNGSLNVNIGNNGQTLTWYPAGGSNTYAFTGTLKFCSPTAYYPTTFQNPIQMYSDGTIDVTQSPWVAPAIMTGAISNVPGQTAGLVKTNFGTLQLAGSTANTYDGDTTVLNGTLNLAKTSGYAIPGGNLILSATDHYASVYLQGANQIAPSTMLNFLGTYVQNDGTRGDFRMQGYSATVAGISDAGGRGLIENVSSTADSILTVNASTDYSFQGFMQNGGSGKLCLVKGGTATQTLSGPYIQYTGATTISAGKLLLQDTSSFQSPITNNAVLEVNATSGSTLSAAISGPGSLTKTGTGTAILTGSSSYTGATVISGGVLQVDNGVGLSASSFLSLDGGVLQNNAAASFTRSLGTSGNAFQWTANGGGFAAGTAPLSVNVGGNPTPSTLTWGSSVGSNIIGTLMLSSTTAANVVTFQNPINLGGSTRTVQVDDNLNYTGNDSAVLAGAISGTGGLTKTGTGVLMLGGSASNTYSGDTTVTAGTLDLGKTSGYAIPGGNLSLSNGACLRLQGNDQIAHSALLSFDTSHNQTFELLGHSVTVGGIVGGDNINMPQTIENTENESGIASTGTLTINNSADCSYTGCMRDSGYGYSTGTLALVKDGPATLTLSGAGINYSGGTTISAGKLVFQNLYYYASGGYDFPEHGVVDNGTLEVSETYSYIDFPMIGAISGSGSLIKSGPGSVTLSGANGNTYSGSTTVSDGTLALAKTSGYAIPGDFTIANANTFVIVRNAAAQFPATAKVTFSGTGNPHFEVYGNTVTVGGISGSGAGEIENTESETYVGNGTLIVNNAADCSYSGSIRNSNTGSGTLALTKNGTGRLTLTGNLTYTGATTISAGTLQLGNGGSVGSLPSSSIAIAAGGTFDINCSGSLASGGKISGAGTLAKDGGGTLTLSGDSFSGSLLVNNGTLTYSGASILPVGVYTVNGGTLSLAARSQSIGGFQITGGAVTGTGTLTSSSDYDIQGGTISPILAGNVSLIKTGQGAATVSSPAYTGTTSISAGALTFSGALAGGNYVISGGSLNIGALSRAIGTFQLTGGTVSGNGTLTSSANYNVRSGAISSVLGGGATIGLNKTGDGTVMLTNTNTFTGLTTISAGTLQFGGGPRPVTGSVAGNIALGAGGTLSISRSNAVAFASQLSGSGMLSLPGYGTVTMTGANSFSGSIGITHGALDYSGNSILPAGNYTIAGGVLNIGSLSHSIGAFQVGSGGTVTGTGTLTSNAAYDVRGGTVAVNLAGNSIALTKSGSTAAVLTGANSYTGRTTVTGGTLELGPIAQNCVLNVGGADIQSGAMVFDYAGAPILRRRSRAC